VLTSLLANLEVDEIEGCSMMTTAPSPAPDRIAGELAGQRGLDRSAFARIAARERRYW
jgi:hypothetical protein